MHIHIYLHLRFGSGLVWGNSGSHGFSCAPPVSVGFRSVCVVSLMIALCSCVYVVLHGCLYVCLHTVYMCVCMCACLSGWQSSWLSAWLSVGLSVSLSAGRSQCMSGCWWSVGLSVCLCVSLSVCLPFARSVGRSDYQYVWMTVGQSNSLSVPFVCCV